MIKKGRKLHTSAIATVDIEVDRLLIAPEVVGSWHKSLVNITTELINGGTTSIRVGKHYQILED